MTPYFLLLSVPMLASIVVAIRPRPGAVGWLWMLPVFALYVVFVGWRYQVGPDWLSYQSIHRSILNRTLLDTMSMGEPLSYGLFWIAQYSGYGFHLSYAVAAFVSMAGLFAFAMRTPNPFLAVVVATPWVVIAICMSAVRQSMALGVLFFLFSIWGRTDLVLRLALIGLAALFHVSALLMGILAVPMSFVPRLRDQHDRRHARARHRITSVPMSVRLGSLNERVVSHVQAAVPVSPSFLTSPVSPDPEHAVGGATVDGDRPRALRRHRRADDRHRELRRSRTARRTEARDWHRSRPGWRRWLKPVHIDRRWWLLAVALVAMGFLFQRELTWYQSSYVAAGGDVARVEAPGALWHISLVLVPVFFLLVQRKRLGNYLRMRRLVWAGAWASLLTIPLYLISSEGPSRLIVYFYFVPMMLFPAAIWAYGRSTTMRILITIAIGGLHFGILAGYLSYANNAWMFLPYRNLLFGGPL